MKLPNKPPLKINSRAHSEAGFTALQLIFVIAIIGILSGFAVIQLTSARQHMQVNSAARTFAGYVEKARLDAIRRHGGNAGAPPTVQFLNDSSYSVTMDFAGNGTGSTRVVTLNGGVKLLGDPPAPIVFNWRGRTTLCTQTFSLQSSNGVSQSSIDVSGSGDVTIDGDPGDMPAVAYSSVSNSADISSEAVINGSIVPPTVIADDCSGINTSNVTPVSTTGCGGTTIVPSLLVVKKNGGSTDSFNVTVGTPTTMTISGPSNLTFTPTSQPISGMASFGVRSNNNSKSTFTVTFSSACGTSTAKVKVIN